MYKHCKALQYIYVPIIFLYYASSSGIPLKNQTHNCTYVNVQTTYVTGVAKRVIHKHYLQINERVTIYLNWQAYISSNVYVQTDTYIHAIKGAMRQPIQVLSTG